MKEKTEQVRADLIRMINDNMPALMDRVKNMKRFSISLTCEAVELPEVPTTGSGEASN